MSCLPEATWSVYVDGALAGAELRAAEAHLMGCRDCRALVVALRDEAALLSDVLHERERERVPAAPRPDPARGVALGLLPSLALSAAALTGFGWLLEARLPAGVDWLNPIRAGGWYGAYDMAFDLIFAIRDEVPGLLELALAVVATLCVSALLTTALSRVLRRWPGPGAALLSGLALLVAPAPAEAHFGIHSHEDYELAAGEVHEGTLIVSGETANIDGEVDGDLLVLAQRLVIRGRVTGNVYSIAETLELPGTVAGSVHTASERVHVAGTVEGNLYAFAEDFTLGRDGELKRDLMLWAEEAVIEGRIGRDLFDGGRAIELRGEVARNLHARFARVVLGDGAQVGGDVESRHRPGRDPQIAAGARIGGGLDASVHESPIRPSFSQYLEPRYYLWTAVHVAGGTAVGLLLHWLVPLLFGTQLATSGAFFRALGVGLLALVATPVALALSAATIAGIPLALMGLALYLCCLFVAVVLTSELVGAAIVGRDAFVPALLVGLLIVVLATHAPYLGWPARVVVILCGLGAIVERASGAWRAQRLSA